MKKPYLVLETARLDALKLAKRPCRTSGKLPVFNKSFHIFTLTAGSTVFNKRLNDG